MSVAVFVDKFCKEIDNLTAHNYNVKAQSKFLKHSQENLQEHEGIVILDFAENFSFIIQDAIQGFLLG